MALIQRPLPTYVPHFHSDKVIYAAIRAATPKNGIIWDWLNEQARQENWGASETERGIVEGERRFCIRWIDIANSDEDNEDATS